MGTTAEQWVLVEMVQALYEVRSATQGPTPTPGPGEMGRFVRICDQGPGRVALSRQDPRCPWLEGLSGAPRPGGGGEGGSGRSGNQRFSFELRLAWSPLWVLSGLWRGTGGRGHRRGWSLKTRVGTDGKTGGEDTVEELSLGRCNGSRVLGTMEQETGGRIVINWSLFLSRRQVRKEAELFRI